MITNPAQRFPNNENRKVIFDSGCSRHMTSDPKLYLQTKSIETSLELKKSLQTFLQLN